MSSLRIMQQGAQYRHQINACFCNLAQFLGVPHLLSSLNNPIILSTSLSDPSSVLVIPPRYTKFSVCSSSCPSTFWRNFLLPSSNNFHCLLYIYLHNHFLLSCATPVSVVFCSPSVCSASRATSSANLCPVS